MSTALPRLLFVSASVMPPRLEACVNRAGALDAAAPEGLVDEPLLLVDGRDVDFVEEALASIRAHAHPQERPWLLWMPDRRSDEAEALEAAAWRGGAQDILREVESEQVWRRQLLSAKARMTSADGFVQQLRRLRGALESLQASVDNIPAPIFLKDVQGRYSGCNRAFCDFLGRARDAIIGKTVYDIAPAELAAVYHRADQALLASGQRQIYDAQVRWSDGTLRDVTFFKAVFHGSDGEVAGQAGAIFDITERRRLEQKLRELAGIDALTGLPNRRTSFEEGETVLKAAAAENAALLAVMIDVDHFKVVNDGLGHAAGDALLKHIAAELRTHLRAGDLLARLGGDEFAVLLRGEDHAQAVFERLPAAIAARPLAFGGREIRACISLGGACVAAGDGTLDAALSLADRALYEAKRLGRNQSVMIDGI